MPVLTKINTNSIAEDAITGDKFAGDAYLSNTANQNISGTYSENRLYTSDAYTLSGNATVNSNITLSTVKSTGDVVLTAGGAYTITGTGVLSGGSLLAKERSDLTGMTGTIGSGVTLGSASTIDNTHTGVQHPFNATSSPAFAVGNDDGASLTNVDTTWRKVEWTHSSGTNATSGGTAYLADHLFNIGGMFDLSNDWFLPTVAGYYCFSYYVNIHNVGADVRYNVRFYRSADTTGDWYDQFFTASEQTSTSAQTNFGFTSGPVYMNGTTHRAFIMHQVHSGSYGFNKGSHQMGFRGWRVG